MDESWNGGDDDDDDDGDGECVFGQGEGGWLFFVEEKICHDCYFRRCSV